MIYYTKDQVQILKNLVKIFELCCIKIKIIVYNVYIVVYKPK